MNRFGSNSYDNENDQFAQNQQIGRQLHENNPRAWNERNNPPYNPDNRHTHTPNYRPDAVNDIRYVNRSQFEQRNQYGGVSGGSPYMPNHPEDTGYRHHDNTSLWTERNDFKDSDYRYRSGHRDYWHEDYDNQYEGGHHRPHPQNFFSNIGQGIREGWNNLMHRHHDDYRKEENRDRRPHNAYENYRLDKDESRNRPNSAEWHNSGPDHRDEDFFDPRNFKL